MFIGIDEGEGDKTGDGKEGGSGGKDGPELGVRPDASKLPDLAVEQEKGKKGSLVEKLLSDLNADGKGAEGQGEEKVMVTEGLRPIQEGCGNGLLTGSMWI